MGKKQTQESYIKEVTAVHDNEYIYSKTIFNGSLSDIIVTCKKHGDFIVRADTHKRGNKCSKCSGEKRGQMKIDRNKKLFLKQLENLKKIHPTLDFSKSVYINGLTTIEYECPVHGTMKSLLRSLLKMKGCCHCLSYGGKISKSDWIERFKKYPRHNISYKKIPNVFRADDKLIFTCLKHGDFTQRVSDHDQGNSCPKCGFRRTREAVKNRPTGWAYSNWVNAAESSKNFDSFKVYIIRCWDENEEFYKIGRTYQKIKNRFQNRLPYQYEVLEVIVSDDARYICELEQHLKNLNVHHKYIPKLEFSGMYECYINTIDLM